MKYEYLIYLHDGSEYTIEPVGIVKTLDESKKYIYNLCGKSGKQTMKWHTRPTLWHGDNSKHYYLANEDVNSPYFGNTELDYMKIPVSHSKIINRYKYFSSFGHDGSLY